MKGMTAKMTKPPVRERITLVVIIVLQAAGALFFVSDMVLNILVVPTRPIPWQIYETFEVIAAVSLIVGLGLGLALLRRSLHQRDRVQRALRAASGALTDLLEERFQEWRLSAAERDVALFAIKGMSTADIARLRNTTEGTVKAQSAAIYRKAGVNSRSQLISSLVEDLFEEPKNG